MSECVGAGVRLSYLVVVIRIHGGGSRLDCDPVDLGV